MRPTYYPTSPARTRRRFLALLNVLVVAAVGVHLLVIPDRLEPDVPEPHDTAPYMGRLLQTGEEPGPRRATRVLQWLDGGIDTTPCIGPDGTLYIGNGGTAWGDNERCGKPEILALEGKTGIVRWRQSLEARVTEPIAFQDGLLCVQTQRWDGLNDVRRFRVADAASGQVHWGRPGSVAFLQRQAGGTLAYACDTTGSLNAYDLRSGERRTSSSLMKIASGGLWSGSNGWVYRAIQEGSVPYTYNAMIECRRYPDAAVQWSFQAAAPAKISDTPVVSADGKRLYFILYGSRRLVALNTENGETLWEAKTTDSLGGMAVGAGGTMVIQGTDEDESDKRRTRSLRGYDEKTGRLFWKIDEDRSQYALQQTQCNPAAAPDGTFCAALSDALVTVDGRTGKILWTVTAPRDYHFRTGPAIAPDGTVYAGAEYNRIHNDSRDPDCPLGCIVMIRKVGRG